MKYVSHWTVPADHPAFAGHFPATPILPGVVLLDAALQIIASASGLALDRCEISSVKFLSPVSPGCILAIEHSRSDSGTIRFDITSGSRKIASGSIAPNQHGTSSTLEHKSACAGRFPHPNPDTTTSHSTKLPENGSQVAGYLPEGEETNVSLRDYYVKPAT